MAYTPKHLLDAPKPSRTVVSEQKGKNREGRRHFKFGYRAHAMGKTKTIRPMEIATNVPYVKPKGSK